MSSLFVQGSIRYVFGCSKEMYVFRFSQSTENAGNKRYAAIDARAIVALSDALADKDKIWSN
ncbi:MAG: hypothetical protein JWO13_435 [Acidobacteriales bacterium]|nr:hypothetical protein [Terriglobales bacterium]